MERRAFRCNGENEAWFAVDGGYWLYCRWQDPVALEMMREVYAPASLSLYWMCGLVWYLRSTAKDFINGFIHLWSERHADSP